MNNNYEKITKCFFLLFIIFVVIVPPSYGQGNVIVSGRILHSEYFMANIKFYKDNLEQEEEFIGGILEDTEDFRTQFKIPSAIIARLEHGNNQIDIYLEPGDSLHISFDNWDMEHTLKFSGMQRATIQNKYLQDIAVFNKPYLSGNNSMHFFRDLNEVDFQNHVGELKKNQLKFLKEYQKNITFSPSFANYALCEIEYNWAAALLNYPAYHQFFNNIEQPLFLDEVYYRFLKKVDHKGLYDLNSSAYRGFLDAFISLKMENIQTATNVLHRYFYKNRINTIKENLTGNASHYMLAQTFISAYQRGQLYDLARDVEMFLEADALESYKDVVDKLYKIASTLRPGQTAPNFQLETIDGQKISFSDLKGKVLYVDFWATWCGPCKTEIEEAQKLKGRFSTDEVVFIYISLDEEKDKDIWKWYIRQNAIEGLHLFTDGAFASEIAKAYNVTGVPTFYLIDKDGKIASNTPKRPSQPGIEQEIQAILNFSAD